MSITSSSTSIARSESGMTSGETSDSESEMTGGETSD